MRRTRRRAIYNIWPKYYDRLSRYQIARTINRLLLIFNYPVLRQPDGGPITNRQKFVSLSSLVEELSLKVTGIKCPQTSDDSLFADGGRYTRPIGRVLALPAIRAILRLRLIIQTSLLGCYICKVPEEESIFRILGGHGSNAPTVRRAGSKYWIVAGFGHFL